MVVKRCFFNIFCYCYYVSLLWLGSLVCGYGSVNEFVCIGCLDTARRNVACFI